ncbi:MAG: Zn-dependent hydrolase [Alcaligenaceae bacterium]|nr:MAG: Zn-dependent hydrolase [Alcaligenaceae bacterium]
MNILDSRALGLRIQPGPLLEQLNTLADIGMTPEGGCCRLALSEEDRLGRDLLITWMKALKLEVSIDPIGNIFGWRAGLEDLSPVMTGSHIDTVRTGGRYDGPLGVLGGLEVVRALNEAGIVTRRPLVVAAFTNEEGARFHPDMLGSLVYVGGLSINDAYASHSADGKILIDELTKIGYVGKAALPLCKPHAFVELHIEQGPILDIEGITIGAVRDLQGISWQELTIVGQSNHAGTTPMRLRHDAGYCAAAISVFMRELTIEMGGAQVATMGVTQLHPNLINVIAARAVVTVDLRNTDEVLLKIAEQKVANFLVKLAADEGVKITSHRLARFEPVKFDDDIADLIAQHAQALGYSCRSMTSGAGHDAQMLARLCPSAMIFVPSVRGISHNPAEHTEVPDLVAGGNVLLQTMLELAK